MPNSKSGIETDHVNILLDIKSEIGSLNANMKEAIHSRDRLERGLVEVKNELSELKPIVVDVKEMKPRVAELLEFKARIGSYIVIGGAIVMGALTLLWQGITFFSENIKAGVGKMFH